MPFRATFPCLWCGRPHRVRSPADLEGWAQLCPDCLGRAGENPFLRFRLRSALEERAGARPADQGPGRDRGRPGRRGPEDGSGEPGPAPDVEAGPGEAGRG